MDEKQTPSFHGELGHVSLIAGPLTLPLAGDRFSIAIQGRLAGAEDREAPVYCSGWIHLDHKDMDLSCKLEPLPLAAFEPYYEGVLKRVQDATLTATSHVTAKANVLEGRAQLEIANVTEHDLSVVGKTLADLRKVAGDQRMLSGELQLSGPMDSPKEWKVQLVPGNEIVQRLVGSLLAHRIETIPFKVGEQLINVGLPAAKDAAKATIEAASKTVQETLELLAPGPPTPAPEPEPAAAPAASEPAAPGAPAEASSAAGSPAAQASSTAGSDASGSTEAPSPSP